MKKILLLTLSLLWLFSPVTAQRKRHPATAVVVAAPPPPQIFTLVTQKAVFNGDAAAWIREHIHYPQAALENDWEGIVQVLFEINPDGSVHFLSVSSSSGFPLLDNEAQRVITAMPRWKPAKLNGRAVPYSVMLPVVFRIS